MTDKPNIADIRLGISLLFKPGQLVELRVRTASVGWRGFYFDDHEKLAETVARLDDDLRVVSLYYVINPVKPSLIRTRATCECEKCKGGGLVVLNPNAQVERILVGPPQHLTQNEDVDFLQNLFIDFDTVRAPYLKLDEATKAEFQKLQHESATKEEKLATRDVANKVLKHLEQKGFPQPLMADSGNGYHVIPRVRMSNAPHNTNMLLDCIKALGNKFNCDACHIDASVSNPARLTRAYGTMTRKGTDTPERPYRRNRMLQPAQPISEVPLDQILTLASQIPSDSNRRKGDAMPVPTKDFDPQMYFDWFADPNNHPRRKDRKPAFEIVAERESAGVIYYITDICLIAGHKHTGSGVTGFGFGDSFGYHCFSDDCEGITLKDLHAKLREEGYEPYPEPMFEDDAIDHMLDFSENVQALDETTSEDANAPFPTEERHGRMAQPQDEPGTGQSVDKEQNTEGQQPQTELITPIGGEPVAIATDLIAILLDDNSEEARGSYIMYRKRLDQIAPHLDAPVGDALLSLVSYERVLRKLPTATELKDYVSNHPDNATRKPSSKNAICEFIDGLRRDKGKTLDVTAIALLDEVNLRLEKIAFKRAFAKVRDNRDIHGGRMILRKHWAVSTSLDSGFKSDPWQLRGDEIYQSFERDVMGTDDGRKFETGFPSIDNSGMNIGLDGEHAIVLYGPASNRKTTAALSMALNFSMRGKHGLYIAGEHQTMRVLKSLTLMLSHFMKKEIGEVPGLSRWEGLNRKATEADLAKIKSILTKLSMMEIVPGYLEVQNAHALTRGENDKLGAIMSYAESTHKKYQWDYIVIDPLDSIMPPDDGPKGNNWKACSTIVDRLFDYSRSYAGDRGVMVITTAQFKVDSGRDIAKLQEKNTGEDNYDDQIEAILRKDSMIQYFTTICQRFDLGIGIATSQKNGNEGMLVQGRTRGGGNFGVVRFVVGDRTNYLREKKPTPLLVEEARIELAKDGML
jgi:hypothetical protein